MKKSIVDLCNHFIAHTFYVWQKNASEQHTQLNSGLGEARIKNI